MVLDGHLNLLPRAAAVHPGVNGTHELTVINQAIGVLIEQGHLPDQAHDELLRRAAHHGRGLPGAADDLLTATACPLTGRLSGPTAPGRGWQT